MVYPQSDSFTPYKLHVYLIQLQLDQSLLLQAQWKVIKQT